MAEITEIQDLDGQIGKVTNNWVILSQQRNGLNIRRKFKGLATSVDIDNNVQECIIYYFEQELYPNHTEENPSIIKTIHKAYHLKNIGKRIKFEITPSVEEGGEDIVEESELRAEINTLNTYINEIGQNGIVNPVNVTLADLDKLPLDVADIYTLNSK